tara:strand:- start:3471 stop:3887 length:417 start_codon:yes stop_codon:yes gene_type:complete
MAKKIPLTLIIDNQDRVLGVKELSKPGNEVIGIEHGGTGRVGFEDGFILLGNGKNPIISSVNGKLTSNGSVSISSDANITLKMVEVLVDESKININSIIESDDSLPIDRVGEWSIGMQGWEDATDDLSNYNTSDTGDF